MRIETPRLIVRTYEYRDKRDVCEYMLQRVSARFERYPDFTAEKAEDEIAFRLTSSEFFAIELKAEKKVVGNVYMGKRDFNARELGYVLNERYFRQGIAFEACAAAMTHFFESGTHRIYAETCPENVASWGLMEKLGMKKEAHFIKNASFLRDENGAPVYWDTFVYAKLNPYEKTGD